MASDRARISFDPTRAYRAVVAQQGRVTLEADVNEQAVIDVCADLIVDDGFVTQTRPDVVAGARTMARILDDPEMSMTHATVRRQLRLDMDSLRSATVKKSKGRLAAIQRMTNRRPVQEVNDGSSQNS